MDLVQSLNTLMSLFVICSPFVAVPMMIALTQGNSDHEKKRVAVTAGISVAVILIGFCWLGTPLFSLFGIRLASLQIGGGFVVFLLGLSCLRPAPKPGKEEEAGHSVAVVPLAIPLMAGPGAIGQVIIAAEEFPAVIDKMHITAILVVVALLLGLCLYFSRTLERWLGKTGLNVMSNLGGLVMLAIAVETIVKGITAIFPGVGV